MKTSGNKKFLAASVVFLFALVAGSVALPSRSDAFAAVVHDPISNFSSVATAGATTAVANSSLGLTIKEYALDPLAYTVSKVALHTITRSVVNWINSGFDGSPAFVQDLQGEFLRIGDTVAQSYIDDFTHSAGLDNLPGRDEIGQAVLSSYFRSTSKDGFVLDNPYNLDKLAKDPQAFLNNGDYAKGGLDAYMSVVLNQGENPLATYFAVKNGVRSKISSRVGEKLTELNWGDGFSAFRGDCGKTKVPPSGNFFSGAPNSAPATSLKLDDPCVGKPIKTPSALRAQSANKYLVDSGLDQYISSDEISELVVALMGQLVNNVIGGKGVSGLSDPSSGGGRSYIDTASDPAQFTAQRNSLELSSTFLATIVGQAQTLKVYQSNWQKISTAASLAKSSLTNSTCVVGAGGIITTEIDPVLIQAGIALGNTANILSR